MMKRFKIEILYNKLDSNPMVTHLDTMAWIKAGQPSADTSLWPG